MLLCVKKCFKSVFLTANLFTQNVFLFYKYNFLVFARISIFPKKRFTFPEDSFIESDSSVFVHSSWSKGYLHVPQSCLIKCLMSVSGEFGGYYFEKWWVKKGSIFHCKAQNIDFDFLLRA